MVTIGDTTYQHSNEAVLVGCEDFSSSYFGYHGTGSIVLLRWKGEHLEWVKLDQFLKHSRTKAIAMLLPDSMTDCTAKCKYNFIFLKIALIYLLIFYFEFQTHAWKLDNIKILKITL